MTKIVMWLLFQVMFRMVWAIVRAIGQETYAALRDVAPKILSSTQQQVQVIPAGSRRHCGQCGNAITTETTFCAACGLAVNLEREGIHSGPLMLNTCRSCGAAVDMADRYCMACGSPTVLSLARGGQRPAAVEVAATLHTVAGAGVALMTLPFAGVLGLGLAGNAATVWYMQGIWLPLLVAIVTWGMAWSGFSFAAAWGLRAAKAWALHATIAVSLFWSLTGIGAIVALPLILALLLPGSRAFFGKGRGDGTTPFGGFGGFHSGFVVIGRR